jgi:fructoselysine-6-P-deglycase FrlB-like protein
MTRRAAMTILVVATARDPHRQAEALRAALGLTLRGARVEVIAAAPPLTPLAGRLTDTLRAFGHPVTHPVAEAPGAPGDLLAEALARADRVEVWT